MKIYQGEPIGFKINVKNDDGGYLPSLEGMSFEALLTNGTQKGTRSFSTEDGSIELGVETTATGEKGYASFGLTGTETAELCPGNYTFEIAKVLEGGRAIGIEHGLVGILEAKIKKGI